MAQSNLDRKANQSPDETRGVLCRLVSSNTQPYRSAEICEIIGRREGEAHLYQPIAAAMCRDPSADNRT